jgi:hypothetical protein
VGGFFLLVIYLFYTHTRARTRFGNRLHECPHARSAALLHTRAADTTAGVCAIMLHQKGYHTTATVIFFSILSPRDVFATSVGGAAHGCGPLDYMRVILASRHRERVRVPQCSGAGLNLKEKL